MCIVLHAMMIMTDTDVLEAEVMTEEDQEVGPSITTIEDLIVLESKWCVPQWSVRKTLLVFNFLNLLYTFKLCILYASLRLKIFLLLYFF